VTTANPSTSPPTAASFTATATAINQQAKDTTCATYTINNLGQQTATNTGCW
jgi:Tfp pilus assembly protein PilE